MVSELSVTPIAHVSCWQGRCKVHLRLDTSTIACTAKPAWIDGRMRHGAGPGFSQALG